jgi:uncharacterized membrane protein YfcA
VWVLFALFGAGAFAGLVDGALGMGFGVTTTSILLALGLAPAAASASVHAAKVAGALANGAAHWRFGNVDRASLPWLAGPGCAGAVVGAVAIFAARADTSRPVVAAFLMAMGALVLWRQLRPRPHGARSPSRRRTAALGFAAGGLDAFGGGGWGPIATPGMILMEGHEPRKAVGTVNLAEFFVSVVVTVTLLMLLGASGLRWDFVAALAIGSVATAPLAAHLARRLRPRYLAELVAVLLIALNTRTLATDLFGADPGAASLFTLVAVAAVVVAMVAGGVGRAPPAADAAPAEPAP